MCNATIKRVKGGGLVKKAWAGMDLQRSFLLSRFEVLYLRSKGTAFQELFRQLMELAYPRDFVAVHPSGSRGDLKCDGYRKSDKTVFQCYAPREMKLTTLLRKMETDFLGAKGHWNSQMEKWTFVHNDDEGLPADALMLLNTLEAQHAPLTTHEWGYNALRDIVLTHAAAALETMMGPAPTRGTLATIGSEEIAAAVLGIQEFDPGIASDTPIAPTTAKLNDNGFSSHVREQLRGGMVGAYRVQVFFSGYPVPDFADKVAAAFHREYEKLASSGLSSDRVYNELFRFAGGDNGDERRRAAVLAVLSYFFERCDIFKEPVTA